MNAIENNPFTSTWQEIGASISAAELPRAIVAVSAHWYGPGVAVTAMENPATIHDFYGFPQQLNDVEYPASGDPEIAELVREIAKPTRVAEDFEWGIDHGTWSVLVHMFPAANIPVVQVSIDATAPLSFHMELGSKLARLTRTHNVLLIGSGNVVHNLRALNWRSPHVGFDWAERFDEAAVSVMLEDPAELGSLTHHRDFAAASPTPDHFLPLAYIAGAAQELSADVEAFNNSCTLGSLSMTGFSLRSR